MAERAEQHDLATLGYLADLVNLYPPHLSVRVHADMHMHMQHAHACVYPPRPASPRPTTTTTTTTTTTSVPISTLLYLARRAEVDAVAHAQGLCRVEEVAAHLVGVRLRVGVRGRVRAMVRRRLVRVEEVDAHYADRDAAPRRAAAPPAAECCFDARPRQA